MVDAPRTRTARLRAVSAKIFGNEKVVEVLRALNACQGTATAQEIHRLTTIDHAMVRIVLLRLVDAGLLTPLPRASSRGSLNYEANMGDPVWQALTTLADVIDESAVSVAQSDTTDPEPPSGRGS